jgi:hypothetical protein
MSSAAPFEPIGTVSGVLSGGNASVTWPALAGDTEYEWYVTVSDGAVMVTSPTWRFTTGEAIAPTVAVLSPNGGETGIIGVTLPIRWNATDNVGVTGVDVLLSRAGAEGPFETISEGLANSGAHDWTITGPVTADAYLKVIGRDAAGNEAADLSDAAFAIVSSGGVDDAIADFALVPMSSNPVVGTARFEFAAPRPAHVRIEVIDIEGRIVATPWNGPAGAGRHHVTWGERGAGVPPGFYVIRMSADGRTFTRRLLVLR